MKCRVLSSLSQKKKEEKIDDLTHTSAETRFQKCRPSIEKELLCVPFSEEALAFSFPAEVNLRFYRALLNGLWM